MVLYPLGDPSRILVNGAVASALKQEIRMDYEAILVEQYRAVMERYGQQAIYSRSHWEGCCRAGTTSAMMPSEAPAEWISCNACLIRRGYIRIVHCDPRIEGWPRNDRRCEKCDYGGIDCETWLRVKDVGTGVGRAIRRLDPEAEHFVTWADIGFVPFKEGPDPEFDDKASLDAYCAKLLHDYPDGMRLPSPP